MFAELLERIDYRPETHVIVSVGDLVNRGENSPAVVHWFEKNGYAVRGNHEDMWMNFWAEHGLPYDESGELNPKWDSPTRTCAFWENGQMATLCQFRFGQFPAQEWLEYLASLPHAIVIGDYLIVHAGVDPNRPFEEQDIDTLTWVTRGFVDYPGEIPTVARMGKRLVVGHCETFLFGRIGEPVIRPDRVHIDLGTANEIGLAAFCLNDERVVIVDSPKREWQVPKIRAYLQEARVPW
ncbi:Metallophosphoesterase [Alicyclobacillus acidocaldarius subsp. acidocaldarius Tc-4-1]|uniref:Metallophosphoesterase n=2 Tax=Alicyclobacillus acidocaldarius TaxID=405212 RepID=F8IH10_ALIAT|nr:Metallophosphoesterase [Alicyclobacillus acidocaldarius subsp. acidocaldarius Tc-4-1]